MSKAHKEMLVAKRANRERQQWNRHGEVLCSRGSYHAAHRDREFHRARRAEMSFNARRAFKTKMAAVHGGDTVKVVEFAKKPLSSSQMRVLESIRRTSEQRLKSEAERVESIRLRNLGNPYRRW